MVAFLEELEKFEVRSFKKPLSDKVSFLKKIAFIVRIVK